MQQHFQFVLTTDIWRNSILIRRYTYHYIICNLSFTHSNANSSFSVFSTVTYYSLSRLLFGLHFYSPNEESINSRTMTKIVNDSSTLKIETKFWEYEKCAVSFVRTIRKASNVFSIIHIDERWRTLRHVPKSVNIPCMSRR